MIPTFRDLPKEGIVWSPFKIKLLKNGAYRSYRLKGQYDQRKKCSEKLDKKYLQISLEEASKILSLNEHGGETTQSLKKQIRDAETIFTTFKMNCVIIPYRALSIGGN